jgi:hypothetical protein
MVVLAAQNVYMQRASRRHCKGVKYVRDHLRGEITDLFALDAQVGHAIGTRANVDNSARKSLSAAQCDDCILQKGCIILDLPRRVEQIPCHIDEFP